MAGSGVDRHGEGRRDHGRRRRARGAVATAAGGRGDAPERQPVEGRLLEDLGVVDAHGAEAAVVRLLRVGERLAGASATRRAAARRGPSGARSTRRSRCRRCRTRCWRRRRRRRRPTGSRPSRAGGRPRPASWPGTYAAGTARPAWQPIVNRMRPASRLAASATLPAVTISAGGDDVGPVRRGLEGVVVVVGVDRGDQRVGRAGREQRPEQVGAVPLVGGLRSRRSASRRPSGREPSSRSATARAPSARKS